MAEDVPVLLLSASRVEDVVCEEVVGFSTIVQVTESEGSAGGSRRTLDASVLDVALGSAPSSAVKET